MKLLLLENLLLEISNCLLDQVVASGLVVITDGKVIEEGNCFRNEELITSIFKMLRNVKFEVTSVST
jgi:hypothetical protein